MKCQLRDLKVVIGAEIGSDHYLLLMIIKLKIKGEKPRESRSGGGSFHLHSQTHNDRILSILLARSCLQHKRLHKQCLLNTLSM